MRKRRYSGACCNHSTKISNGRKPKVFPTAELIRGANAIVENVFMKLGTEWEGFSAVPDEFLDAGDNIVALGHYSGKYNADRQKYEGAVRARLDFARRQSCKICSIHGHIKSFRGFVTDANIYCLHNFNFLLFGNRL